MIYIIYKNWELAKLYIRPFKAKIKICGKVVVSVDGPSVAWGNGQIQTLYWVHVVVSWSCQHKSGLCRNECYRTNLWVMTIHSKNRNACLLELSAYVFGQRRQVQILQNRCRSYDSPTRTFAVVSDRWWSPFGTPDFNHTGPSQLTMKLWRRSRAKKAIGL